MIIELKWNHSAKTALNQIHDRNSPAYPAEPVDFGGDILLVGINYAKRSKKHTCRIENMRPGA